MKLSTFLLIILITFNFTNLNSEENNDKIKNKISKNIRCLICQGQSVYDSQSDFAVSIKLIIDKKLNEGLNESEIYDFLKNQYGEWISYDNIKVLVGGCASTGTNTYYEDQDQDGDTMLELKKLY